MTETEFTADIGKFPYVNLLAALVNPHSEKVTRVTFSEECLLQGEDHQCFIHG